MYIFAILICPFALPIPSTWYSCFSAIPVSSDWLSLPYTWLDNYGYFSSLKSSWYFQYLRYGSIKITFIFSVLSFNFYTSQLFFPFFLFLVYWVVPPLRVVSVFIVISWSRSSIFYCAVSGRKPHHFKVFFIWTKSVDLEGTELRQLQYFCCISLILSMCVFLGRIIIGVFFRISSTRFGVLGVVGWGSLDLWVWLSGYLFVRIVFFLISSGSRGNSNCFAGWIFWVWRSGWVPIRCWFSFFDTWFYFIKRESWFYFHK